ncbi:hypothetical protein [Picosynechococcus sp. PCC 7117]|uniref:hypothetical protein n=1 Tax=Picosynechococcus sp. PCC 7117 TaxID=195498 RepID=UPI00081037E2|nr:hypothetical protein [Picosynechococcus sp. PCC 7117]ANV88484.1 hypothetical protein AWQ22_14010 [Picosynechococcus sp. PCC 7117]
MNKNKRNRLTKRHDQFILLLLSLSPSLELEQISEMFENKYGFPLKDHQLSKAIERVKDRIDDLKDSEALTLEIAYEVGFITLHSRTNRILALEDIVHKNINGYKHQVNSPKGEIVEIIKKDHKVAIEALKAIKSEMGKDNEKSAIYNLQIGEATPNDEEDDLESDDEL